MAGFLRINGSEKELHKLRPSLLKLAEVEMEVAFPNLTHMSVTSIYGKETDRWSEYSDQSAKTGPSLGNLRLIVEANKVFKIMINWSNIQHLCIRDFTGPLSLPTMNNLAENARGDSIAAVIHFGFDKLPPPLQLGARTHWRSDISPLEDLGPLITYMSKTLKAARRLRAAFSRSEDMSTEVADLEIFLSTEYLAQPRGATLSDHEFGTPTVTDPEGFRGTMEAYDCELGHAGRRMPPKRQKAMIEMFEPLWKKQLHGPKDVLKVHPVFEMPVCEACGSGQPV